MKFLLTLLVSLLTLSAQAQLGFPTVSTSPDFYSRLRLEGKGIFDKQLTYPSSFTAWPATPASVSANGGSSGGVYMGQIQKFPGKAWWVEAIDVNVITAGSAAGDGILLNMVFQNGSSAGIRSFKYQGPIPTGRTTLPVRQWLTGNESITFSCVSALTSTDKIVFSATPIAVEMTDCLNWTTKKLIVHIGDSITECTNEGTIGAVMAEETWPRKVWKRYIDKGEDVRYVNLAQAGQTASQAEQGRLAGFYSIIRDASLVTYMEGINDVGGNSTATQLMQDTYVANVTNMIRYFLAQNKANGKLILMAPTPVGGTAKHAVAEVYRSLLQSTVASIKAQLPATDSGRIIFVNMAGAYPRTDRTYYYSGEPVGNEVHPNPAGNQAMFDFLDAQVLTPLVNTLP